MNSHLIGAAYLLNRSGVFFAQATSLDTAIGGGMGILARIAYLGAFAMIIAASWNVQKGQSESAKWSVMGALAHPKASLSRFGPDLPLNLHEFNSSPQTRADTGPGDLYLDPHFSVSGEPGAILAQPHHAI